MGQGYQYQEARDMFYTLSAQKEDEESILVGQQTEADAVEDLLSFAEHRVAEMLFPFFQQGKAPQVNNLVEKEEWTGNGVSLEYSLPSDFYMALSGYIVNGVGNECPIDLRDYEFHKKTQRNPYYAPGPGTYPHDYVPAYIKGENLVFFIPPASTRTDSIVLFYYKMPKYPSGSESEIHHSLLEMTVLFMLSNYFAVDGDDLDIALLQTRIQQIAEIHGSAISTLGYDPFKGVS